MKKIILLYVCFFILTNCGEKTETKVCVESSCQEWERCSLTTENCVLKKGRCNTNSDCDEYMKCNETHNCYSPIVFDKYEVTTNEFSECITAGNCTFNNYNNNSINNYCNLNKIGKENHPMNCVNWFGANEYCNWKEKRLPSEEEWEYGAKGGEDFLYSGSDVLDEVAWYIDNSNDSTQSVGSKLPNAYGLFDMMGNVHEWTDTWWDSLNEHRILKGGGFLTNESDFGIELKGRNPAFPYYTVGFRCVKDVNQ